MDLSIGSTPPTEDLYGFPTENVIILVVTSKISESNVRLKVTSGWMRHFLAKMFGNIEISIDPG